ncbi:MAG TPA: hypothetical protein VLW85_19210 [Myxococcales bacterium]|nr:hypothetical protein [Myxococcales bacterium]
MIRSMLRSWFVIRTALFLVAAPVLAQDRSDGILVLADDGALEPSAVHAIRNVALGELRKRGITIIEDRRTEGVHPVDESVSELAGELGARRVFALRVGGRLGQKIPLSLDELAPRSLVTVYSASLTATGLEECDIVTTRLVDAVVDRRSAESNAEMRTVTASEARPFAKKPGERFWFVGLPVALYNANSGSSPFGFTVGYGYEAENFRISATAGGYSRGNDGVAYLVLEGAWIPFESEISPYLGGGLGYMGAGDAAGMGAVVEGGFEFFRLHGVRALAGAQLTLPFFDTQHSDFSGNIVGERKVYPAAFVRLAF